MNAPDRWRCAVCETFNRKHDQQCIVCDQDKNCRLLPVSSALRVAAPSSQNTAKSLAKKQPKRKVLPPCRFPGCEHTADGKDFCTYHQMHVCRMCLVKLKAPGMDYCVGCGTRFAEKSTVGLKRVSTLLFVVDIALLMLFVILLVAWLFLL